MIQTPISSILGVFCAAILLLVTTRGKEGIGGGRGYQKNTPKTTLINVPSNKYAKP